MGKNIWSGANVIDLRDVTDRVDELRGLTMMTKQEMDEFDFLVALLEKCKDKGGGALVQLCHANFARLVAGESY